MEVLNLLPFIFSFFAGLSLLILSLLLIKVDKTKNVLKKYIKKEKFSSNFLDKWLDSEEFITNFENKNEKKFAVINNIITSRTITKILIYSIIGGILFSLLTRNILLLPISIFICYYAPFMIFELLVKNKVNKIEEQFGTTIKFFITEFTTTKNIVIALQNITTKIQNPVKGEIERLIRELNSGISPKTALTNFSDRLDNKFVYIFSNLLISYFDNGTDFTERLLRLSEEILENQIQKKEDSTELSMVRATNLILNGVFIISLIVLYLFFPSRVSVFYTIQGQMLMTSAVLLSFISILIGLKFEE